ncbi:sulfotransferase [Merismopedia glauca CCAP 1448/3]|uniref:Sulfotransferase n=1 Tax=Merismopedia glauca CCAP 1448/3 TaxID=1296344 RepID=A0A2T1C6R2_9CYAN|nr:sulfotransferase [Merismopedia glauca CCAP 1448/3]
MSRVSKPVFLVGSERSGTTLLRLMLDHHPQLAWCNEFEYVVDLVASDGEWPKLEQYYEWLEIHRIFQATKFTIDPDLNYPQLVNSFLLQKLERTGKPLVGATVHRHFDRLLHIWPDARFIHIIRDGRDVARSYIDMGWAGNVWAGATGWIEAEQLWQKLSSAIPPERRTDVIYEDLIAEPEKTLTRLCEFIGIPYDSQMLTYPEDTTYDAPNPKLTQQWRRKLSENEIQLTESRMADMLVERGYDLSGLPSLEVTPSMEQNLKFEDWWGRFKFRVKVYGLPLVLSAYLAKRLGVKSWQKNLILKSNSVDARLIK